MLKITIRIGRSSALVLEGALVGVWVEEARRVWQCLCQETGGPFVVDLNGVSSMDTEGRSLVAAMSQAGADLRASGCYTVAVVRGISESLKASA